MTTTIVLISLLVICIIIIFIFGFKFYNLYYKHKESHKTKIDQKINSKNQIEVLTKENEELNKQLNNVKLAYNVEIDNIKKDNAVLKQKLSNLEDFHAKELHKKNLSSISDLQKKVNHLLHEKAKQKEFYESKIVLIGKQAQEKIDQLKKEVKNLSSFNQHEFKKTFHSDIENYKKGLEDKFNEINLKLQAESKLKSQEIISNSIWKLCNSQISNYIRNITTLPIVIKDLENWKGKIIGKGGNNQKVFEKELGVTFEFPNNKNGKSDELIICNYNPENNEIAKIALNSLVRNNSFNIVSIKKAIDVAKKNLGDALVKKADEVLKQLRINISIPKELKQILGRLSLTFSYGQNMLKHSIEVAILAREMAKELGLDANIATLCGLFHDIGKAFSNLDHVIQGERIITPYMSILPKEVKKVIVDHHNKDSIPESIYTVLVVSADAISAGRPGVRKQSEQKVFERLQEIENLCNGIKGIKDVKVLRSGHQLFLYVNSEIIQDKDLYDIEVELKDKMIEYGNVPGTISVTIYREVKNSFFINKS